MNNDIFNKPLYPPNEQTTGPNQNQNSTSQNNFSLQNLLPLLMGMNKGGGMEGLASLLSKSNNQNPIFDMLSSFTKNNNKKESTNSPKTLPDEEYF